MYITEYDIEKTSDSEQESIMKDQFPVFWEHPYVAGVTLWGYIYGTTWRTGTGLINNGTERPALTWLKSYVSTHKDVTAPLVGPGASSALRFVTKTAISMDEGQTFVTKLEVKSEESVSFSISGGTNKDLFVLSGSDLSFKVAPVYSKAIINMKCL